MDEQTTQQAQPQPEPQPQQQAQDPNQADIDNNKVMGILAYIFFLIPLLAAKDSKFAMYHANQGLILFLCMVGLYVVGAVLPFIGWLLLPLGNLVALVFMIIGIINAAKGEMKPLPVIGSVTILK